MSVPIATFLMSTDWLVSARRTVEGADTNNAEKGRSYYIEAFTNADHAHVLRFRIVPKRNDAILLVINDASQKIGQ